MSSHTHPPAANDAQAAQALHTTSHPGGERDLFSELEEAPALPPQMAPAPQRPAPPSEQSTAHTVAQPEPPSLSYTEALQLMALGRAQGPQALTPEQHHAIWDCLLAQPESQAWLATQLQALQGELQERGLVPCRDGEPC
ncbi:hypothetical protein [Comamonas sp. GB3 AK4-5]|uniref:hypothetical protein n=1 Tax=Comamonas sp. GB3 AK4-5 TaxID=3231487 RepID=UPI00351F0398